MWIFLFFNDLYIKTKTLLRIGFPIRISIYGCIILQRSIFIILFSHKKYAKKITNKKRRTK